jgi:bacterioferritin
MKHATMTDVSAKPVPLTDIPTLRKRAREHIDQGAVTTGYAADRDKVIAMLNEALATELVCVLRYRRHYFMASGIHASAVATEFLAHAAEELAHADLIAKRIAERIAIESYREMIVHLGEQDSTTRRMLEGILACEEEHAEDLSSLMDGMKHQN